jgi:hypothetical protein
MLFDLRGGRRRRLVQAVYLTLAVLLGGGLVLFGIGGDVQGGLVDGLTGGGNDDGSDQVQERVETAEEAARRRPRDPQVWAALAEARFQFAGVGENFDAGATGPNGETGTFTDQGRGVLREMQQAWRRHLELAGERPNAQTAAIMTNALLQAQDAPGAVRAQEIVIDSRGEQAGFGDFAKLAQLAYLAGQTRKGDLAADRAVEEAPRGRRQEVRQSLEAAKAQAQAQGAGGQAVPAPTATTGAGTSTTRR